MKRYAQSVTERPEDEWGPLTGIPRWWRVAPPSAGVDSTLDLWRGWQACFTISASCGPDFQNCFKGPANALTIVRPTLEVVLTESPEHLHKRKDPESGLALIDVR